MLVELAIVLTILAIVSGSILAILNTQLTNSRYSATKTKQEAIKTALINFIARNNRLPCPAVPTAAQGAAAYGVEAATPGTCTGATVIGAGVTSNSRGVVPWVTLGLPDDAALDGFNRRVTYQVLRTQTNTTATTIPSLNGNITIRSSSGGVIINTNNSAVVVLVSHGENGWGAYLPMTGTRMTLPTGADEVENTDNDTEYVQKDFSSNTVNPFDDVVTWLTPNDLLDSLRKNGTVESTSGAVNERFQAIRNALIAYVAADSADPDGAGARTRWRRLPYADRSSAPACAGTLNNGQADNNCLVGNVPWTTIGLAQNSVTDPWGNVIRYTVAAALATSTAVSGLTASVPAAATAAITLAAAGADGALGTADDVTMTINVGELRGVLLNAGIGLDP